jgi:hypothetical protein
MFLAAFSAVIPAVEGLCSVAARQPAAPSSFLARRALRTACMLARGALCVLAHVHVHQAMTLVILKQRSRGLAAAAEAYGSAEPVQCVCAAAVP